MISKKDFKKIVDSINSEFPNEADYLKSFWQKDKTYAKRMQMAKQHFPIKDKDIYLEFGKIEGVFKKKLAEVIFTGEGVYFFNDEFYKPVYFKYEGLSEVSNSKTRIVVTYNGKRQELFFLNKEYIILLLNKVLCFIEDSANAVVEEEKVTPKKAPEKKTTPKKEPEKKTAPKKTTKTTEKKEEVKKAPKKVEEPKAVVPVVEPPKPEPKKKPAAEKAKKVEEPNAEALAAQAKIAELQAQLDAAQSKLVQTEKKYNNLKLQTGNTRIISIVNSDNFIDPDKEKKDEFLAKRKESFAYIKTPRAVGEPIGNEILDNSVKYPYVVVINYMGLTVAQDTDLRNLVRNNGGAYKVFKNTATRTAYKNTIYAKFGDRMEGPSALCFFDDIEFLKELYKFSNRCPAMIIEFGMIDLKLLEKHELKLLSEIPTKKESISRIAGILSIVTFNENSEN